MQRLCPFDITRNPERVSQVCQIRSGRVGEGYDCIPSRKYMGSSFRERKARETTGFIFLSTISGIFVPARLFTYPSASNEIGEQLVGMRDTNAFSFYDIGLIEEVRYLSDVLVPIQPSGHNDNRN